jgi:hypothetical protein
MVNHSSDGGPRSVALSARASAESISSSQPDAGSPFAGPHAVTDQAADPATGTGGSPAGSIGNRKGYSALGCWWIGAADSFRVSAGFSAQRVRL